MATNKDQFNIVAQELVDRRLYSGLWTRKVLLSILTGRQSAGDRLGRPAALDRAGKSAGELADARAEMLRGSSFRDVPLQNAKYGGGKKPGYRGSNGSVNNADVIDETMRFFWTPYTQPMLVWEDDVDVAQGSFKRFSMLEEAVNIAMNELEDDVASDLFAGSPTSQTAKKWDDIIGLRVALDDGSNHTTYGGVNKTTETMIKPALYSETASTPFAWALIDAVDRDGAATKGKGVDLIMTNEDLFFDTILPKARAEGQTIIHAGAGVPTFGNIGFQKDSVMYRDKVITWDTAIQASHMYCLSTESLELEIHPDSNFKVSPFVYLPDTGVSKDRAHKADIDLQCRFVCTKPWLNGLYTSVV